MEGWLEARIRRAEENLNMLASGVRKEKSRRERITQGLTAIFGQLNSRRSPQAETVDTDCCSGVPLTLNLVLTTPAESFTLTYTSSMNVPWVTDFDWEGIPGWLFDDGSVAIAFWCNDSSNWQFEYYRAPLNNGIQLWSTYSCPLTSLAIDIPDRGAGRFIGTISVP